MHNLFLFNPWFSIQKRLGRFLNIIISMPYLIACLLYYIIYNTSSVLGESFKRKMFYFIAYLFLRHWHCVRMKKTMILNFLTYWIRIRHFYNTFNIEIYEDCSIINIKIFCFTLAIREVIEKLWGMLMSFMTVQCPQKKDILCTGNPCKMMGHYIASVSV